MPGNRSPGRVLSGLVLLSLWALGPAAARGQSSSLRRPAADHYDVVALRVEFQPDTTRFTTGDGTFDGALYEAGLQPSLDPLPHDAAYFQAHLDFLEHYVRRVSDGQTQVTTHLVPDVVRLSKELGAYSPTGLDADSDAERAKLVALIEEAWASASQISAFDLSGFDPERTAFVIFHAGVGRDIELLGTPLDKTPQDLPSLFFSERELERLGVGVVAFNGFPVRHTLILPRTETRAGFNFIDDTPFLLELSINGLLAASFFNYLGVPDLFNTTDGRSAIGPFGLMDPLGFFAYNGLFASEPSAWTKYFLGWTEPVDLAGDGSETVPLPAVGLDGVSAVARVRISSAEYFLVENRHRDVDGDGLVLQVWKDGQVVEQRIQNGDATFTRLAGVGGFIGGVVVGVDDYDWALPGGLDEDGNDLNGGILIWHVDERRLAGRLETGGVNDDPERRAIDLEEADSAQDIGFPPVNPFGPAADQGTPFDFFFLDNPITTITATGQQIRFYENRFGPATIPNSNSNEGGPSFIVLEDFSAPGPEMTFVYRREALDVISPIDLPARFTGVQARNPTVEGSFITALGQERVEGLALRLGKGGIFVTTAGQGEFLQSSDYVLTPLVTPDDRVALIDVRQGPGLQIFSGPFPMTRFTFAVPEGSAVEAPTSLLFYDDVNDYFYAFFAGGTKKTLLRFEQDGVNDSGVPDVIPLDPVEDPRSVAFDGSSGRVIVAGPRQAQVLGGSEGWSYDLDASDEVGQVVFGRDRSGLVGVVPVLNRRELLFLRADATVQRISLSRYDRVIDAEGTTSLYPVLVDLDADGRFDVLTTQGRSLVAFSQNGALLAGFPLDLPALSATQPLVAALTDSGGWSVLVSLTDGYLYAYDFGRRGELVPGFPLAVGETIRATPLLQGHELYAIADGGYFQAWDLANTGAVWWGQLYGNAQNQSYVALAAEPPPPPAPQATGLIVEAETYNWPNPIRAGQTFLRCMTTEDASVRFTIIDVAGSLIDEVTLEMQGGTPAEHLWQTDAASGLYFARVTATTPNGQTATKLIKMAIIR